MSGGTARGRGKCSATARREATRGLLSIPIFFLLVLILLAILFPRLMRALFIAVFVFVGVAWLIDAPPDKTTSRGQELRR
jgi:hypothetical protein